MINFDEITNNNQTEINHKYLYIPDHRYRILIVGDSGSAKYNALLDLISHQQYTLIKFIYMPRIHMSQNVNF